VKNPMQPLAKDRRGVVRFKENTLVNALLEHGQRTGLGLNELAGKYRDEAHTDDWRQLAQLIGYSLSGYGELSYVDDHTYETAAAMADDSTLTEDKARIAALEAEIAVLREAAEALRGPVAVLLGMHPDDLKA
jgi:hypothetical protein